MLQNILNLEGIKVLTKKNQQVISGGQSFQCTCGFNGSGPVYTIDGGSLIDALQSMGRACNGAGAQCGPSLAGAEGGV